MTTTLAHKNIFDIKAQVLTLPDDVTDAQLAEAYNTIESINCNLNWWRGDLYAHVAKVRPTKKVSDSSQLSLDLPIEQNERVKLMMEQSAHPRAVHRMACRVSAVLAPNQRKPTLSWDYHAVALEECGAFNSDGGDNLNDRGDNLNDGGGNLNDRGGNLNDRGGNLNDRGTMGTKGTKGTKVANALRWLDWVASERAKGHSVSISDLRQMIRDTRADEESKQTISNEIDTTALSHVLREAQTLNMQVRKLKVEDITLADRHHLVESMKPLVIFFDQLTKKNKESLLV